jgi:hypothetical protein
MATTYFITVSPVFILLFALIAFPLYLLIRYLQAKIRPRESGGRLLLFMALSFGLAFLAILLTSYTIWQIIGGVNK